MKQSFTMRFTEDGHSWTAFVLHKSHFRQSNFVTLLIFCGYMCRDICVVLFFSVLLSDAWDAVDRRSTSYCKICIARMSGTNCISLSISNWIAPCCINWHLTNNCYKARKDVSTTIGSFLCPGIEREYVSNSRVAMRTTFKKSEATITNKATSIKIFILESAFSL